MADTTNKPVIFLAFANDRGGAVDKQLNLPEEARRLRDVLGPAEQAGLCEVVVRSNSTAGDIFKVFQDPRYRNRVAILHYGGHANGYQLLLESAAGQAAAADAGGLAAFLAQQQGLQLVFLNGCSTQQQTQGLLDANISAVISTSRAIDDQVATDFSYQFYQGLAGGATIRTAYHEAEAAVQTANGGATRALYFGAQDDSQSRLEADRWPWILRFREGAEVAADWNLPDTAENPMFSLPALPDLDFPDSPFQYLSYFTREHANVFFGRGYQIRELYQKVADQQGSPIILFYGQSGVGKSSLLDAGLLPRLEANHEVRYLRRRRESGLLDTLQLAFLPEGHDTSVETAWRANEHILGKPLIVILDQVEEVFTRPNEHQPKEIDDFLKVLCNIFLNRENRPQGKLILGFRKEWLPELGKALSEHKLPRAGVFLERLDSRGVVEAVRLSDRVREHYGLKVDDDLPARVAADLLADKESAIAPTLQVLLSTMWDAARNESYSNPCFDEALYSRLKSRGLHLGDFLGRQLNAIQKLQPAVIESGLALDVLACHTTDLGTAEQRTKSELRDAYNHVWNEVRAFLRYCKDKYLLVDPAGDRPDVEPSTRLAHDTLAPIVRKRFDESDLPGQRARRILEARSPDWDDDEPGVPLDEADLRMVENGSNGTRRWNEVEERLVKASRAARKTRHRRQKVLRNIAFVALLAIAGLSAFAGIQSWQVSRTNKQLEQAAVRLGVTNGVQRMDEGDLLGSLAWFGETLKQASASGQEQTVHRMRICGVLNQCPRLLHIFFHNEYVEHAEFSPDGKWLVTASWDKTARVWDLESGKTRCPPLQHDDVVMCAKFSPDGRLVVTASWDKTVRIWDAATGKQQQRFEHSDKVEYAQFSPDSRLIVSVSNDGTARVWDMNRGAETVKPVGCVNYPAFSTKGDQILTVGSDGSVHKWNALTGQEEAVLQLLHSARVVRARFSRDGQWLVTASTDDIVRLWNAETGEPVGLPMKHRVDVNSLAISIDAQRIITASSLEAQVWDAKAGTKTTPPLTHKNFVMHVEFSPDGSRVLTSSWDGTARVWDANSGQPTTPPLRHRLGLKLATFSPDGQRVATASDDGTVRAWDLAVKARRQTVFQKPVKLISAAINPKEKHVLTAGEDGIARVWDMDAAQFVSELRHDDELVVAQFSPNGSRVLTATKNGAYVWNPTTGKSVVDPLVHNNLSHAEFSPNDQYVVTANKEGVVRIWEAVTGRRVWELQHDQAWVLHATFSPDSSRVVTSGLDKAAIVWKLLPGGKKEVVRRLYNHDLHVLRSQFHPTQDDVITLTWNGAHIWDVATGKKKRIIAERPTDAPQYNLACVEFSPNGESIVTGDEGGTARVWDAKTGKAIGSPLNHQIDVVLAHFDTTGSYVVTASLDGMVRVWDAETGASITPPLRHRGIVEASFTRDSRRVVTVSNDGTVVDWNLELDQRPVEDLLLLTQLLSNHRIDETAGFVPLETSELRAAWERLRSKYPGDITDGRSHGMRGAVARQTGP